MQVTDKVFVVTGGGRGIGREVVLGLLQRGARVAAVAMHRESLEQTSAMAAAGERLTLHTCDVSDRRAVEALADSVLARHGHVDGLLNVAGIIQQFVPFAELSYEQMERVMSVNLWGTIYTTKTFLPVLLTRPEACVVNVSSMGGFLPVPGQTVYGASKAAVKLLTEGLYSELRDTAVSVTIVFPGAIATDIITNSGVEWPGAGRREISVEEVAHRTTPAPVAAEKIIVEAVERGSFRVTLGKDAAMLDRLVRLAPQRATDFIARKMADLLS